MIDLTRAELYFDGLEHDPWGFKDLRSASTDLPARLPINDCSKRHTLRMVTLHSTAQNGGEIVDWKDGVGSPESGYDRNIQENFGASGTKVQVLLESFDQSEVSCRALLTSTQHLVQALDQ
jgi:hypothetical protein